MKRRKDMRGRNRDANTVDAIVGQRIRERRNALQLTLPDLATDVGVTQQQLQKYEVAANRVSASRLYALSVALGVPVGYFFEGVVGARKQ